MSIARAMSFINALPGNPAMQDSLRALSQASKDEAMAGVLDIARSAGFTFSREEYLQAVKEHLDHHHDMRRLNRGEHLDESSPIDAWCKFEVVAGLLRMFLF